MSLVEKALRKMQSGSRGGSEAVHGLAPVERALSGRDKSQSMGTSSQGLKAKNDLGWLQELPLIHIDRERLRREGLLPPAEKEYLILDQFRHIKRSVIRSLFDSSQDNGANALHSVMVASALPGDGKTFTCLNLALSLALEHDYMVTLVDGDMPKSHIGNLLGIADRPGILDAANDPDLQLNSILVRTDVPGLYCVPAGKQVKMATELMASRRMTDLFEQLACLSPNNIVVFDSSPLLLTSEARVLAGRAQRVLLVVKAGVTPQHAVREAVDLLGEASARVGLLLNGAETKGLTGYGYGYGGGVSAKQSDASS